MFAEECESALIGSAIEGRSLARANVTVEASIGGRIRAESARRMVAENQGQPPTIAVAHGLEQAVGTRDDPRNRHRGTRRFA